MRLLHTADIHLDASFAGAGLPLGFGNRRRQSLRDVFSAIMKRAVEWPADAVLIAGDLFEQERVSRDTVAFLREAFQMLRPIPVFISPGNHDPLVSASPYVSEAWPANVFVFNGPRWTSHVLQHLPLTVHGFGFDGIDISSNPFGALEVPRDGRVHVAVGHGSELRHQPPEKAAYAPFDALTAVPPGLHYFALGHFHAYTPIEAPHGAVVCYSGSPEGHGFNEPGPRHYVEVTIEVGEETVRVKAHPVVASQCVYQTVDLEAGSFGSAQQLVERLRALSAEGGHRKIARVRLVGHAAAGLTEQLQAVQDAVADGFELVQLLDETQPAEDYSLLARENTSLGSFINRLNGDISAAPDEARRAMLVRARELGLAAYRNLQLPLRGAGANVR